MREFTTIQHCIERDGKICGICKGSIEKELDLYMEYRKFAEEVKKQKRALQIKLNHFRKNHVTINIDHIIPHSKGGLSIKQNYQISHIKCNIKKGNNL